MDELLRKSGSSKTSSIAAATAIAIQRMSIAFRFALPKRLKRFFGCLFPLSAVILNRLLFLSGVNEQQFLFPRQFFDFAFAAQCVRFFRKLLIIAQANRSFCLCIFCAFSFVVSLNPLFQASCPACVKTFIRTFYDIYIMGFIPILFLYSFLHCSTCSEL